MKRTLLILVCFVSVVQGAEVTRDAVWTEDEKLIGKSLHGYDAESGLSADGAGVPFPVRPADFPEELWTVSTSQGGNLLSELTAIRLLIPQLMNLIAFSAGLLAWQCFSKNLNV